MEIYISGGSGTKIVSSTPGVKVVILKPGEAPPNKKD